jgi:hypothetical protein
MQNLAKRMEVVLGGAVDASILPPPDGTARQHDYIAEPTTETVSSSSKGSSQPPHVTPPPGLPPATLPRVREEEPAATAESPSSGGRDIRPLSSIHRLRVRRN